MLDLITGKVHDETRQGEAFEPFANDVNQYNKRFYIESYGCQMNFSDSEIVEILSERGIPIARRTVAKYRTELNILPSHMRRKY